MLDDNTRICKKNIAKNKAPPKCVHGDFYTRRKHTKGFIALESDKHDIVKEVSETTTNLACDDEEDIYPYNHITITCHHTTITMSHR